MSAIRCDHQKQSQSVGIFEENIFHNATVFAAILHPLRSLTGHTGQLLEPAIRLLQARFHPQLAERESEKLMLHQQHQWALPQHTVNRSHHQHQSLQSRLQASGVYHTCKPKVCFV